MLNRLKRRTARIGIFGVVHDLYWDQFPGLFENLSTYHAVLHELVSQNEVEVVDYGIVDSNRKAFAALEKMRADKLDILFCNMLTYATSSVFMPIMRDVNIPVVLVALQPLKAMDYTKASTHMQLENDNVCSVPEFTGVAIRYGKRVSDVIIGTLYDDPEAHGEIRRWCDVAKVLHDLKGARFGLMGHVLEAMYDMHADPTAISSAFGVHVPLLEVDDLLVLYDTVTEAEIAEKSALILDNFDTPDPQSDPITTKLTQDDLYHAAKAAVALDQFIAKYELTGLAYYYNGRPDSLHRKVVSSLIVGNSMLIAQGVSMCGEFDIKTCLSMFIMDRLDIGGSFAEFHPFDFKEDFIFVGHDGPHHIKIADGKPILRSLMKYHGKPGHGASVEFKLKEGPITMLCISQNCDGTFKFIVGEGLSKKGPIPPTGNTNTRGFFGPTTKEFIKKWVMEGPTHHYALGIGHHADTIQKVAQSLGIACTIIKG